MTLKEELEILRGEPIQVFTGDPMDIPCIETSDPEKLCKNPVVSVHMITYNHEPYIRQAIEGVMMQKTDFEFELVIGEDCSTDKTREICFEYQKKYPDKIRVLWWHKNLYRNPHPAGENARRNRARCRGEFMAICEGDDCWIDPLKLQKQVDIMRKFPNVGLCFAKSRITVQGREDVKFVWNERSTFPDGLFLGREFILKHLFDVQFDEGSWPTATFIMTASVLIRRSVLIEAYKRYEIFDWRLMLGDTTMWLGLASLSDVFYLPEEVSLYRQVATGLCQQRRYEVSTDGRIVRLYYFRKYFQRKVSSLPIESILFCYYRLMYTAKDCRYKESLRKYLATLFKNDFARDILCDKRALALTAIGWLVNRMPRVLIGRYAEYVIDLYSTPAWIKHEYKKLGIIYRNEKSEWLLQRLFKGFVKRLKSRN